MDLVLECAAGGGQIGWRGLTRAALLSEDKSLGQAPFHSVAFKRQVAQEFIAGETLIGLAKRYDILRNLIQIWVQKYEAGPFDDVPKRLTS